MIYLATYRNIGIDAHFFLDDKKQVVYIESKHIHRSEMRVELYCVYDNNRIYYADGYYKINYIKIPEVENIISTINKEIIYKIIESKIFKSI